MTKKEVDKQTAAILGIHISTVTLITSTFLRLATKEMASRGYLSLENFGDFEVKAKDYHEGHRVAFKGRAMLNREITRRMKMDKSQEDSACYTPPHDPRKE